LNISIPFGDIRGQSGKGSKIGPNLACFGLHFLGGKEQAPKLIDRDYKTEHDSGHVAKFRADRPTDLGDLALKKKELKNCSKT